MTGAEAEDLLKRYKKKPIVSPGELSVSLQINKEGIKKIIPHREPMLLVDSLTGLDVDQGVITGTRYLDPKDPVFSGHFPEYPVYPGNLQIEMVGQLGLCLYYFVQNKTSEISPDAAAVDIRATKVLGALFSAPLLPGTEAVIMARQVEFDGFFGAAVGQVISGGTVCCTAVGEVVFP